MKPFKIGPFTFDEPVFLAPMAGVTDTAYRVIAHDMGCPLAFAEMVSSQGIHYRNEHTMKMLRTEPDERPIAMQIFAKSAAMAAEAAAYIEEIGTADILDFNMGCPAPKVVKNGEGSALMRDPKRAEEILTAIRRATKLPFTVKMRLGWDDSSRNAAEIAKMAEAVGVDAIAVHGRTREQFYSGNADYAAIAEVKRAVGIPVIVSGDIRRSADLSRAQPVNKLRENPRIPLRTGEDLPPPTLAERAQVILRHLDLLIGYKGEYIGIREMRRHAAWYTRGLAGSAELREQFNRAVSREDFAQILHDAWEI